MQLGPELWPRPREEKEEGQNWELEVIKKMVGCGKCSGRIFWPGRLGGGLSWDHASWNADLPSITFHGSPGENPLGPVVCQENWTRVPLSPLVPCSPLSPSSLWFSGATSPSLRASFCDRVPTAVSLRPQPCVCLCRGPCLLAC